MTIEEARTQFNAAQKALTSSSASKKAYAQAYADLMLAKKMEKILRGLS